jgi:hypothetical protein
MAESTLQSRSHVYVYSIPAHCRYPTDEELWAFVRHLGIRFAHNPNTDRWFALDRYGYVIQGSCPDTFGKTKENMYQWLRAHCAIPTHLSDAEVRKAIGMPEVPMTLPVPEHETSASA